MSEDNFILVSLDDEKSKAIAEIIGSKTCKKIINYLAEHKEASQKDLSIALKIPMNTIDYNIKKLLESGFISKTKNFFWSKKGKKIILYELSKKSVVISHKKSNISKLKSILPAFILTGAGTFAVWAYEKLNSQQRNWSDTITYALEDSATKAAQAAPESLFTSAATPLWAWFLAGSLLAIFILSIINWRKL